MRMIIASVVIPAALAATAAASPPASVGDIVTTPLPGTNIVLARKLLPPSRAPGVMAQSKVIYLNHLGVTLTPGDDDSTTNHSSIIGGTSAVPAWNTSAGDVERDRRLHAGHVLAVRRHRDRPRSGQRRRTSRRCSAARRAGHRHAGQDVGGVSPFTDGLRDHRELDRVHVHRRVPRQTRRRCARSWRRRSRTATASITSCSRRIR